VNSYVPVFFERGILDALCGLVLSIDRPHRSLSYMIEQVVPNWSWNLTEDVMRRKHPNHRP
jgi:hypothetical protein